MKPNLQTASSREIVPTPRYFDADLVVSRNATGDIRSRYGDPIWDLSSSSADGTTRAVLIFFSIDCSAEHDLALVIREQQKALMWLYKSRGPLRSLGTLLHANHALSILSEKAFERRITLFALLIDPERMSTEMESLNTTYLSVSKALIESLWRYGKELGLEVQIPLSKLKGQIASQRRSRSQNKQTPIIPSRVYCSILGRLISYLDEIERELPELLDAQRQCVAAYRALKSEGVMRKRVAYRAKMLAPVVASMKRLGYDPSCRGALDAFVVSQLALFQAALMHTIAAFSGMRVGEVSLLPLFGVEETFQDRGAVHYEIKGYTQKLEHGRKRPTSWITNREGHRAVLLAQRIASTNFELLGTPPVEGQEALLFATPKSAFRKKGSPKILKFQRRLIEMVCPVVTQVDIDELNELELSRGWQHEGIEVGKRWPLTFHQLRRSLSVYAHRSGMVSLPALKAQLQHITDEMRAYYADGYSRAVNLVFDKEHFSHEWNAARAESSYFGYTLGLLFSDDELFGRGAERMAKTVANRSREETLGLFRDGKLAYRETALGGCISTEECQARPLEPIPFDCLETDCVNQVILSKRLDHVVRTQQAVVSSLERSEAGSVEHRLEANNLRVLLKVQQRTSGCAR